MNNFKGIFKLTAPAVFIASLCCIAPIVIVLLGLSSVSFAIALTDILDRQYQWMFILAGLVFMGFSIVKYFRGRGICTIDQARRKKTEIINKVLIVLSISIAAYIVFFYGILGYIGRTLSLWE